MIITKLDKAKKMESTPESMNSILVPFIRMTNGYKGTGKDTWVRHTRGVEKKYNWAIYSNPKRFTAFPKGPSVPVTFALALKKEVKNELGLPLCFDIEKDKDRPLNIWLSDPKLYGKSFRNMVDAKAQEVAKIDKYRWCKLAFSAVEKRLDSLSIDVTDFRLNKEWAYALSVCNNVYTTRVFRKEVPIPPPFPTSIGEDPEHNLDNFQSDFLVVPYENRELQFIAAVDIFPQYTSYQYIDSLMAD